MNTWISAGASLVAAFIGGGIAIFSTGRTLKSQINLQDRSYLATIMRELAGRLVAVEIALDSFSSTGSDTDRQRVVSVLDELLPQARVVGFTVPPGQLREKFDAVGTEGTSYRKHLLQKQSPAAAESRTRKAMKDAMDVIGARFSDVEES